jgi:hypothetical protein
MRNKIHEAILIGLCLANSIMGLVLVGELICNKNIIIGTLYVVVSLISFIFVGRLFDESNKQCRK